MSRLSSEQVLNDNNGGDPISITNLHLTHKALSDVSCLANFKNLEKLDLKFNSLTSLEGLRSCVNLKWLSVVENKLDSLEGIQGLTKLTVLNAGKNKLKSMDQVSSIVSLRALILNDNEITSICQLDRMKELNTLVLSKNPIRKIGEALMKVKSLTKLSLSHCQLQGVDTSLMSCVELVELRLAHNEIKSLPKELVHNSKLRNLDLGNNVIPRWSELEALKSLTKLKNLNLQGNPVAANDKVTRKIKKALPRLQIFNARPVDKDTKNEKDYEVDTKNEKDYEVDHVGLRDGTKVKKSTRFHPIGENEDDHLETADEIDVGGKSSKKRKKNIVSEKETTGHNKESADRKKDKLVSNVDSDKKNKSTTKKLRKDEKPPMDKGLALEENVNRIEKKMKKKGKKQSELDVIDDAEASFMDFFNTKVAENPNHGGEMIVQDKVPKDLKLASNTETSSIKHKSGRVQKMESLAYPATEIGIGGPSTWGDE